MTTIYLYGLGRLAQFSGDAFEWFLGDALGSVRQVADDAGKMVLTREYGPYGQVIAAYGDGGSGYGYAGEQTDAYTELVFPRARYYAPSIGRFHSQDQWLGNDRKPGTLNRYVYVLNSPPNGIDPSGMLCLFGFGNCGEEPDLAAVVANLPFYIIRENINLPGNWGSWGGIEYGIKNTKRLSEIFNIKGWLQYQFTYVPLPLSDYEISLVERYADRYGIPPELLAATLEAEIYEDTDWYDPPLDYALHASCELASHPFLGLIPATLVAAGEFGPTGWRRNTYGDSVFVGWGPGMAQFHTATARRPLKKSVFTTKDTENTKVYDTFGSLEMLCVLCVLVVRGFFSTLLERLNDMSKLLGCLLWGLNALVL